MKSAGEQTLLAPPSDTVTLIQSALEATDSSLLTARVLQMEYKLFRTVMKSKKPGDKVPEVLAAFTAETKTLAFEALDAPIQFYAAAQGWGEAMPPGAILSESAASTS